MSAERLSPEPPVNPYLTAQPNAAPQFEASKDGHGEKKNRKRKKNRRKNRSESSDQPMPAQQLAAAAIGRPKAERMVSAGQDQAKPLAMDSDTFMLWQRPEAAEHDAGHDEPLAAEVPERQPYRPPEAAPPLEAEPIHEYQPPESGTNSAILHVEPISVETRKPVAVKASVAAFERGTRQPIGQRENLPRAAKAAAGRAAEAVVSRPQSAEAIPGSVSERQRSKQEILKIAKDIKIDGVRLKDVFSANRIDEAGLRSVVETYLRGGDVKQQLSQEIFAKEQSYERDPQMRHLRRNTERERTPRTSQTGEKIGKLLGQVKEIAVEQGGKIATSSQKTAQKASRVVANGAKQAQHDIIDNSSTRDWLSITAVVVLYSIILILLLN